MREPIASADEPRSLADRARDLRSLAPALLVGLSLVACLAGLVWPAAAAVGGVFAVGLAGVALLQLRRLARQADKLSGEIDILSTRLLRIEAAPPPAPVRDADPRPFAEIAGEMSLLGGIVRDLAESVAAQDREIAEIKAERADPLGPVRATVVAAAEPRLPVPVEAPAAPHRRPSADKDRAEAESAAILAAFETERLDAYLQPIVSLPQRKTRLYEALARLRLADETVLVPAEFLPEIERRNRLPELDRRILIRSAAIARHLGARGSDALVLCNVSAASLGEPGFLKAVARLVEAHPDLPGRLVLELSQRCWRDLDADRAGALSGLRDKGLVFSLDRATDLRLDPLTLADRGVRFVKLPAAMLLDPGSGQKGDIAVRDLAAAFARAGIHLIAEKVEREEEAPDLIDLDIPLAQGFLFAPPRPVRPEVFAPPATPAPAPAEAPRAPPAEPPIPAREKDAAQPERLPLRAFLRRAG